MAVFVYAPNLCARTPISCAMRRMRRAQNLCAMRRVRRCTKLFGTRGAQKNNVRQNVDFRRTCARSHWNFRRTIIYGVNTLKWWAHVRPSVKSSLAHTAHKKISCAMRRVRRA